MEKKTRSYVLDEESELLLSNYANKIKISKSGVLRILISKYCRDISNKNGEGNSRCY